MASPLQSVCSFATVLMTTLILSFLMASGASQLSPNFYNSSCPQVEKIIRPIVEAAIIKEHRMGASLLRLFFHDCFVHGCDGSILLDDLPGVHLEKSAPPNLNSARGFDIVDAIKNAIEAECSEIVSCADILAVAARDAVELLGGPTWEVRLGRRDATTTSQESATENLPSPLSDLSSLITKFADKGLSVKDMVALSGAHSIGQAGCKVFRDRIYNESNIDKTFAQLRQSTCPRIRGFGDDNQAPLDPRSPNTFDGGYYRNLVEYKGLLHSDQQLFSGGNTNGLVRTYSSNSTAFVSDFVAAMLKMGDIDPLTESNGEIRKNWSVRN